MLNPHIQAYADAFEPIRRDMVAQGFDVDAIPDLESPEGDPREVPILIEWLPRVTFLPLRMAIVYRLGMKWAKPDSIPALFREFWEWDRSSNPLAAAERSTDVVSGMRHSIADSLSKVVDREWLDEIIEAVTKSSLGQDRVPLVRVLGKMKKDIDRLRPVVVPLLDDPSVAVAAAEAASKLRIAEARPGIELLLDHEDPWVRQQARNAMKRLSMS